LKPKKDDEVTHNRKKGCINRRAKQQRGKKKEHETVSTTIDWLRQWVQDMEAVVGWTFGNGREKTLYLRQGLARAGKKGGEGGNEVFHVVMIQ